MFTSLCKYWQEGGTKRVLILWLIPKINNIARSDKAGSRYIFNQIEPNWPLLYSTLPVPLLMDARPAGWVNCFSICVSAMPRAQKRAAKASILKEDEILIYTYIIYIYIYLYLYILWVYNLSMVQPFAVLLWALGIVQYLPTSVQWQCTLYSQHSLANCIAVERRFNSHRRHAATPPLFLSRYDYSMWTQVWRSCPTFVLAHTELFNIFGLSQSLCTMYAYIHDQHSLGTWETISIFSLAERMAFAYIMAKYIQLC